MRGAQALMEFAGPLSDAQWRMAPAGDGRTVGVIVHHVASVYPLEVKLAQMVAAGTPIVGVTWATVHEMNAAHAAEFGLVAKHAALSLLAENSAAAADAIRAFSDADLDRAVLVSLYADAELTCAVRARGSRRPAQLSPPGAAARGAGAVARTGRPRITRISRGWD